GVCPQPKAGHPSGGHATFACSCRSRCRKLARVSLGESRPCCAPHQPNQRRRPIVRVLLRSLLPALAILLLLPLASAQTPKLYPFTADVQVTSTRADRGPQNMTGKLFVGTGHLRMNMEAAGHETAVITDFATQTSDILMVDQQMY